MQLFLFILLSFCDLLLTWVLLVVFPSFCYESNPVARYVLDAYGWAGLAGFKLTAVAVVLICYRIIVARRPKTGKKILEFGCAVLAVVVFYSSGLTGFAIMCQQQQQRLAHRKIELTSRLEVSKRRRFLVNRLTNDLIANHLTLAEAIRALQKSETAVDSNWRKRIMTVYESNSQSIALASFLLDAVRFKLKTQDTSTRVKVLANLNMQLHATFNIRRQPISLFSAAVSPA